MKKIYSLFILSIVLFSCNKEEDISCSNAELQICNTTTNQVVLYGWNTNQLEDTIFPGQCVVKDYGMIEVEYNMFGNEKSSSTSSSSFHTGSGTYVIEMTTCNRTIEAPGGYVDISHCFNGMMDNGEFGVDCGGNCPPCDSIVLPCSANIQSDKIVWQTGSNDDLNSASELISNSKMRISYRFYSGQEMTVELPVQSFPTSDRQFTTGSAFSDAELIYNDRTQNMSPAAGKTIYFTSTGNGTGKIEFCDLQFLGSFSNKTGTGSLGFAD